MIPPAFTYHAPKNLTEATELLAGFGDDAKILAGGHSLLPLMKLRLAQPAHLVDLNRVADLRGIRETSGAICVGAMTLENELIESELLQQKAPLLCEVARQIADPQVRNRGTIGGDLAHGDPANDHPAAAIAMDATLVLIGPKGQRSVPADGFFLGTFSTDLKHGELLKEIHVKPFAAGTGYAYCKLKRKTGDWATAAAAVVLQVKNGLVSQVRIALTNVAPMALRASAAEAALKGTPANEQNIAAAAQAAMDACSPSEDLRGDRAYKTAMTGEMTRRAIRLALSRVK